MEIKRIHTYRRANNKDVKKLEVDGVDKKIEWLHEKVDGGYEKGDEGDERNEG